MLVRILPFRRDFTIEVAIAYRSHLQTRSQGFRTAPGNKMLHRLVDETTALTGSRQTGDGLKGGLGKYDVHAAAHGMSAYT